MAYCIKQGRLAADIQVGVLLTSEGQVGQVFGKFELPRLGSAATLSAVGNAFYGTAPALEATTEHLFFEQGPTEAALTQLSRALDDLRRLGEADILINHP